MAALKGNKNALKHGRSRTLTYRSWESMIARCSNPHNNKFNRYGGRGIKVCDRWKDSFQNFVLDMGERKKGTSIDRLNSNGDYKPSNCRWATALQQAETRQYLKKTHCVHGHIFNKKNTYIRPDKGTKQCKQCQKIRKTIFPDKK